MKKLAKTLLICVFTVAIPFASYAVQPSAKAMTPQMLGGQITKLIEHLEEQYPREQAAFFKIKTLLNNLVALSQESFNTPMDLLKNPVDPLLARNPDGGADLYAGCSTLKEQALRSRLHDIMARQVPVGYQGAQKAIFEDLDNQNGKVQCVYTGREIQTTHEPDAKDMNVEHSWPQSQGAVGDAKCDLHHLFPTDSKANNLRGSYPYGNVSNPSWEQGGSKFDGHEFEVRKEHRGDTARAIFYFAVRYEKQIPNDEETVLRQWSKEDPIDEYEKNRNNRIENLQHNRNAFVDHPEFIDAISDF